MGLELTTTEFKNTVYNFDTKEIKIQKPTMVELYTDWCSFCKSLKTPLTSLKEKYKETVDIYTVNISTAEDVVAAFNIQAVPTFVFAQPDTPITVYGNLPLASLEKVLVTASTSS